MMDNYRDENRTEGNESEVLLAKRERSEHLLLSP